jgi:ATP-dependent Lhr-like helicase
MTSPHFDSEPGSRALIPSRGFDDLHPQVQRWIWNQNWAELRRVQQLAISPILEGSRDVIISAATASGKTEAAWLPICSKLAYEAEAGISAPGIKALYISPLKALINDQFERLESLCELVDMPVVRRHGDVSGSERQALTRKPDGLLLITPEALEAQFVLKGPQVPALFAGLRYVVIDEMHSFIGTERGAQLQSLLHRIELATRRRVVRIGLSATFADFSAAADFLRPRRGADVEVVRDESEGRSDLRLQVRGYRLSPPPRESGEQHRRPKQTAFEFTDENGSSPCEGTIAGHLFRVLRGQDNLVFANSRTDVETYADSLREASDAARVPNEFLPHHGSLSKQLREDVEARLKDPSTPTTAVCTSTLEMGVDIGSADSVAQIGPPYSVAALRQRVGRSGRRGKPAVLRIYLTETGLDSETNVTDRLRTRTFQTAAVVDLMLKHWYEPPAMTKLHLSTLIQQILSVVAQHGGATAGQLFNALCAAGPFEYVSRSQFVELLRNLGSTELLSQAGDGTLLPGVVGERIINHYSFYAAFASSEEYRLLAHGQLLGTIPVDFPVLVDSMTIFAGRRWLVVAVDTATKTIELTEARGGVTPQFNPSSGDIADRIRQKMRELYVATEVPAYLDQQARVLFAEGQSAFAQHDLAENAVVSAGKNCLLFVWRGSRVCTTLSAMLTIMGVKNSVESMTINCQDVTREELLGILAAIGSMPKPTARDLAGSAPIQNVDKYDEYLSESLLRDSAAARDFDVDGAWDELTSIVADHPAIPDVVPESWTSVDELAVLGETPFVVVDVETTGLSPRSGARVVEIALVSLDSKGNVTDTWSTLIDPEVDTGPRHVHGISSQDVSEAPVFAGIIDEVAHRLSGRIVVAHNAPFDLKFLSSEFERAGARPMAWPTLCTLRLSQRLFPGEPANLSALCDRLGIDASPTHAALDDAVATAYLLRSLLSTAPTDVTHSAETLGVRPIRLGPNWPAPVVPAPVRLRPVPTDDLRRV